MRSFQAQARRIVFMGMILVPVVPILVILLLGDWTLAKVLGRAARVQMERIAEDHAVMIDAYLEERLDDLRYLLENDGAGGLAEQGGLENRLAMLQALEPAFQDLGFIAPDGVQAAYAGPYDLAGKDYNGSGWRNETIMQGAFVSDVYSGFRGQPHFTAAVGDEDGAVLRATIDTDAFGELVESVRLGQRGLAYVVNGRGVFQTVPGTGQALLESDSALDLYASLPFRTRSFESETGRGEEMFSVTPVNRGRWLLVVRQPLEDALGGLSSIRMYALALLVLGCATIFPTALLLSRRIGDYLAVVERRNRELEDNLARAARLAELGTMTAGFAHEINNPLQVMTSDISLLEMVLGDRVLSGELPTEEDKTEIRGVIDQLRLQINRCARITQSILRFGRRESTTKENIRLEEYLKEVAEMVRRKAEVHGIALRVETAPGTAGIHADPGKLQQVLLNLLNNAIYAVVQRHKSEGGSIDLRAGSGRPGEVTIRVADNGSGMGAETLAMVFTPFFTTKPRDHGTGLGLSLCYGLIESMGGSIDVASQPGQGTEFTIRLPASTS